ncbi:MAG: MxaK protein [Methylococcales bacterium]
MELEKERPPHLPFIVIGFLALLCVWAVYEGYTQYKVSTLNELIKHPENITDNETYPKEVLFAKAWYLEKQGKTQEALRLYSEISGGSDPKIRENALYNMGTVYLKEGARQWNDKGVWAYKEILFRVELAEQSYREVLALNSQNRSARYNLEYALRIHPPPQEVEKADWQGRKSSVHAVLPGRPNGGP